MENKIAKLVVVAFFALIMPSMLSAQEVVDTIFVDDTWNEIDTNIATIDEHGNVKYKKTLSDESREQIETRIKELVKELNQNVEILWRQYTYNEKKNMAQREFNGDTKKLESFIKNEKLETDTATRKMFIGKAEKYTEDYTASYRVHKNTNDDTSYYYDSNLKKRNINNTNRIKPGKNGSRWIDVHECITHAPVKIRITSTRNPNGHNRLVKDYLRSARNSTVYEYVEIKYTTIRIGKLEKREDGRYETTATFVQEFTAIRPDGGIYSDRTYRTIKVYVDLVITKPGWGYWDIKLGDISAGKTEKL